tara:strand:+ start:228 stop:329 length:102 start_codon:yes stop_codon:yes gene_type:complete
MKENLTITSRVIKNIIKLENGIIMSCYNSELNN